MRAPTLSERLLVAITTETQDAIASGIEATHRVRQRLDTMCDALAVVEEVERLSARLVVTQNMELRRPTGFRRWLSAWKRGDRHADP